MSIPGKVGLARAWLAVIAFAVACSQPTPQDAELARQGSRERAEALPDTIPDLIQARVPAAVAGDSGWAYQQQITADLDDDGRDETAVLLCDVALDAAGLPMWEDGHRWQVYVRDDDGAITRLYARFLPNGSLTADLVVPQSGSALGLLLLERTPQRLAVYEFRYLGPDRVDTYRRLERDIDTGRRFTGSPRP